MNEVIKFQYESSRRELAPFLGFEELNATRQELRPMGLLGVNKDGVGFGNVSLRSGAGFYITGSGTGALPVLTLQDYAKVVAWDFERNWLRCEGQVIASAEALTHAAVYAMEAEVCVVIHGHSHALWQELVKRGPATSADVPYGTPEMASEVQRLFRETNVPTTKLFAMGGHEDGIVAFGHDSRQALATLIAGLTSCP
jgi:Ribulose-5-phosphate 4-epimerase and related epimerases and aldolases